MNDKKQSVQDQAVTAAGGLIGSALGALAGPEGALVGGAAGSVGALLAAKFAPEYFQTNIFQRYLNNRRILKLLEEKLAADFRYSFLDTQGVFNQAMESARVMLQAANVAEPSIETIESRLPRSFRWRLIAADNDETFARCIARLGAYCQVSGPIRIGSPAICPAPLAIFHNLQARFADSAGLKFAFFYDEINARDFFESLRTKCELDFAVGPLETLVLADPERRLPLRIIGPMCGQRQRIFVSTKKRMGFRSGIWVFSRSSAKFQYHVGLEVPRSADELGIDDARQIPDLVESIPPGDMVIAWDPLSSVIEKRRDFEVVRHSDYTIHFMLLGHRRVFTKRSFPLEEFLIVLLTEWRRCRQSPAGLTDILRCNHRYMKAFALGTGRQWTDEV